MIRHGDSLVRDSLTLLPEREEPYRLEAVYELYRDGCRSEIVLRFEGGHLRFRVDEDDDTIGFEFHAEDFERSRPYVSANGVNDAEVRLLKQLLKKSGGAAGDDFDKHGGLLKRGLVSSKQVHGKVQYAITTAGRRALGSAVWSKLVGKNCEWSWVACNQQGYRDSVMLAFDGIVPTVLLCVVASSIEVYSITG